MAAFEHCRQFMVELRWPDGNVKCPRCGSDHIFYIHKERVWKCYGKHDHGNFSLKTGTIFEDSPIALEKWLPATWLPMSCKNGISSYELHWALDSTKRALGSCLHRIRLARQSGAFTKLSGTIEADETFVGGKVANPHLDKQTPARMGKVGIGGYEGQDRRNGTAGSQHQESRREGSPEQLR